MNIKQLLVRKHYNVGAYFTERGGFLLVLCLRKRKLTVIQYSQQEDISESVESFKSKRLSTTIPNLKLLRKKIRFNTILNNQDIMAELCLNQQEYFSGISEKLTYAFDVRMTRSLEDNNQELTVYAARYEEIEQYRATAKKLGLKLCCVEPENIALLRVVCFCQQSLKEHHYYSALIFIRQEYRLVIFTKRSVIHEMVAVTTQSSWSTSDVPLLCVMLEEAKQRLQLKTMNYCFLLSVNPISSEFYSALTTQQSIPCEAILPFQQIEFYVKEEEALLALGSALRGLYVQD